MRKSYYPFISRIRCTRERVVLKIKINNDPFFWECAHFFCINEGNEINYAPFNKGQHCTIRLST